MSNKLENIRKYTILLLILILLVIIGYQFVESRSFSEKRNARLEHKSDFVVIQNIYDKGNLSDIELKGHIEKVCDYAKLPIQSVSTELWNKNPSIQKNTKVITINTTTNLSDASVNTLLEYVSRGGTLLLTRLNFDLRFKYFMGLKKEADMTIDTISKGYFFKSYVIPDLKGSAYHNDLEHFGLTGNQFTDDIRVLATSENIQEYPVLLENKIGRGSVIVCNTSYEMGKKERGLLFSALLLGLEGVPYPIANVSTIFLDNFISPASEKETKFIDTKNYTTADFVSQIWWPDMKKLADSMRLAYTVPVIFENSKRTIPPFLFDERHSNIITSDSGKMHITDWITGNIVVPGHELAFQGYNPMPLTTQYWEKSAYMGLANHESKKTWSRTGLGKLPVTYVPPSNSIDSVGMQELVSNFKSIKNYSSLYLGSFENGNDREFDIDPWNASVYDYPRVTQGYDLYENGQFMHLSTYLYTGIWTHFVRPDELFQKAKPEYDSISLFTWKHTERRGWKVKNNDGEGMFTLFKSYIRQTKRAYPLSRFTTAEKGVPILRDWRESQIEHRIEDGNYIVKQVNTDFPNEDNYWFVYVTNQNYLNLESQLSSSNISFTKVPFLRGFLYNIKTIEPQLKISTSITATDTKFFTDIVFENVMKEFNAYEPFRELPVEKEIFSKKEPLKTIVKKKPNGKRKGLTHIQGNQNTKEDVAISKTDFLNKTEVDTTKWLAYFKLMTNKNRQSEAWKTLSEYTVRNATKKNILFSRRLAEMYGYPDSAVEEKWIAKQYQVSDSLPVLKDYYTKFNTAENAKEITQILEKINRKEPGYEHYQLYVKHLITYDPEKAKVELNSLVPAESSSLWDIAHDISMLYANHKEYKIAYEWSKYSDKVKMSNKIFWLTELGDFEALQKEYDTYIEEYPDDDSIKALMSEILLNHRKTEESWKIASQIQDHSVRDSVKVLLNGEVIKANRTTQKDLLESYTELFKEETREQLLKAIRKEEHNFIDAEVAILGDNTRKTSFEKSVTYTMRNGNKADHAVTVSNVDYYQLENSSSTDEDNMNKTVYGVTYTFKKTPADSTKQYKGAVGMEVDENRELFINAQASVSFAKENSFTAIESSVEPVKTGASYQKKIYQTKLSLNQFNRLNTWLQSTMNVTGNYFSDDNYEGSAMARLDMESSADKMLKVIPHTEASFSKSNVEGVAEFPYYILDKRFYVGGGIGMKIGNAKTRFKLATEASIFLDNDLGNFNRYRGNVSYKIGDFSSVTLSGEFSTNPGAYSNFLQIGLNHIF